MKAGLPQYGVVKQTFYENHFRKPPYLLPAIEATFGARQKAMRRHRSREATSVEIAFQWKYDSMLVCIVISGGHQTGFSEGRRRIPQLHQPASEATARRV